MPRRSTGSCPGGAASAPRRTRSRPLLAAYRARHPKAPTTRISRAYLTSAEAHRGQYRRSGEPYIQHPLAVARIVADLGLDDVTVAAALLHDAVEDTGITLDDLEADFGSDVTAIVDGVTKLDRIKFDTKEAQQAASMRKMLVAMAKDLRVLIIKLSDRLHNMRTIAAMPEFKQERTARETLDIYAPLAHRLGMQEVRQELEDLSFAAMHPKRYAEIDHMVSTRSPERDLYLTQVLEQVRERLAELRINAEVTGRPKHLYSIYEKMVVKGREFDDIFDLVGHPGDRRLGEGLLRRPRLDPRHLEAGAGPVQGLRGDAQVQPVPEPPHHGGGPAGQAARGADPHVGDARPRRAGRGRALAVQGRRRRLARSPTPRG